MKNYKKAIFKYVPNDSDVFFSLDKAQEILLSILADFQNFCDENKICFSLTYGSLLGAVRDKKMIPWDDDVDVMMSREEMLKLIDTLPDLEKYGLSYYWYQNAKNIYTNEIRIFKNGYYRLLENNGKEYMTPLCLDIFPLDKISICENDGEIRKQQSLLKRITKEKSILILKESKYNSKSSFRYFLRLVKKSLYLFVSSNKLHKMLDKNINHLYMHNTDYSFISPFANESFDVRYSKNLFANVFKIEFNGMMISSISSAESFLTDVYGDWKTPHDRSGGKTKEIKFVQRFQNNKKCL